jgi:hypothetical protein
MVGMVSQPIQLQGTHGSTVFSSAWVLILVHRRHATVIVWLLQHHAITRCLLLTPSISIMVIFRHGVWHTQSEIAGNFLDMNASAKA